jgi:hypothetical protein
MKATLTITQPRWNKYVFPAIILVVLGLLGLFTYQTLASRQAASILPALTHMSQSALEEKYGLKVNLIGLTAAGGLVDVRLKVMDGEKLKLLLGDKKNFPALYSEGGVTLSAPEDTKTQKIEFITGGNLFITYPNSGNAIKSGDPVTIIFGNLALEPINAKQ